MPAGYYQDFYIQKAYAGSTTGDYSFPGSAWTSGATIATNCITREYPEPDTGLTSTTSFTLIKGVTHVGYRGFIPMPVGLPSDQSIQLTITNTSGDASLTIDDFNVFILSRDGTTVRQQILNHSWNASTATVSSLTVTTGITEHTSFNPDDRIGFELIYTNAGHGDLTHVFVISAVLIGQYQPYTSIGGAWTASYPLNSHQVLDENRDLVTSTFPASLEGNRQYYLRFGRTTDTFPPLGGDDNYYLWYSYGGATEKRPGWGPDCVVYPYNPRTHFNFDNSLTSGATNTSATLSACACAENGNGYYHAHGSGSPQQFLYLTEDYGATVSQTSLINSSSYFGSRAVATGNNGYGIVFYHTTNAIYWKIYDGTTFKSSGSFTATANAATYAACRNGPTSDEVIIVYKSSTTLYSKAINLGTYAVGSAKTVDTFTTIESDIFLVPNNAGAGCHVFFRSDDAGRTHPAIYHNDYSGTAWASTTATDVNSNIGANYNSQYSFYFVDDDDYPNVATVTNADAYTYKTLYRDSGAGWALVDYHSFVGPPTGANYGALAYWDTDQRVWVDESAYTAAGDVSHFNIGTIADFGMNRWQDKQSGFHFNGASAVAGERFYGVHAWGVAPDGSWMWVAGQDSNSLRTGRQLYAYINSGESDSEITVDGVSTVASMHGKNIGLGGMGGFSNQTMGQWDSTGGASDYNRVEFEFPFYIDSDNVTDGTAIVFGLYDSLELNNAGICGSISAKPYRHGVVIIVGNALAAFIGSLPVWKVDFFGAAQMDTNEIRYLDSDEFEETGGPVLDTTTTDEARSWNFLDGDDTMFVHEGRIERAVLNQHSAAFHLTGSAETTFFGDYG